MEVDAAMVYREGASSYVQILYTGPSRCVIFTFSIVIAASKEKEGNANRP